MTEAGQSARSTRPGQPASVAHIGSSESRGRQDVPRQVDNLRERASRHVLTKQYIFNSDVGTREGARVATSVGRFADRCN